jgi:tetrahydromethanopterin S-methyltransferase subunit H
MLDYYNQLESLKNASAIFLGPGSKMEDKEKPSKSKELKWPPLPGDYITGNPDAMLAVMTCGSYDLPKKLMEHKADKIAIAGFCETENEGLAKIIQNIVSNPHIRQLIVCGERVRGHEPGQTIIALHLGGLDEKYAVVGSRGTIPTLLPTYFKGDNPSKYVKRFQEQMISITDMNDETSPEKIWQKVDELYSDGTLNAFEMDPIYPPQPMAVYDWNTAVASYLRKRQLTNARARTMLGSMFTYSSSSLSVYDLCGVKVGGQRAEYSTVMAGTIFYTKDKIVTDARTGVFDKKAAEELIYNQDGLSLRYEIPVMVHIVGQTSEAIEHYLLFTVDHTDSPIIIDSSAIEARAYGLKLAKDIGVDDRTIYNSIIVENDQERNILREMGGAKYAIILPYEESAEQSIKKASELLDFYGTAVEKPIIDPGVPRLGAGALTALERAWIMKDQLGVPTAIGIHNLHSSMKNHNDMRFDFDYVLPTIFGIDINLYGPIRNAERILPTVAAAEVAVVDEAYKILGVLPRQPHPYYKVFGDEKPSLMTRPTNEKL